jgi:hypothetical protein
MVNDRDGVMGKREKVVRPFQRFPKRTIFQLWDFNKPK